MEGEIMLKKPYEKVMTVGVNNYYLIEMETTTMHVVETFTHVKGWFGRLKEFPLGLQMMPLNSVTINTLLEFVNNVQKVDERNLGEEGAEPEHIYTRLNGKELRDRIKPIYDRVQGSAIKITGSIQNDTVRELIKEGYYLIAIQKLGGHSRVAWLVKSNDFGILYITSVLLSGKPTNDEVSVMSTFVFTKELASKIIEKIGGNK